MATGTSSVSAGRSVAQFSSVSKGLSVSQVSSVSGLPPGSSGGSSFALLTEDGQKITTETGSPIELEAGP